MRPLDDKQSGGWLAARPYLTGQGSRLSRVREMVDDPEHFDLRDDDVKALEEVLLRLDCKTGTCAAGRNLGTCHVCLLHAYAMVQLRCERLEEALHSIASNTCSEGCQEAARVAKAAL